MRSLCTIVSTWMIGMVGTLGADLTSRPEGETTRVAIQMVLLDLEEIRGANQNFTANFAWSARWMDERLAHDGSESRRVPLDEIWHPGLQILNRQGVQETLEAEAQVSPDGEVVMIQRVWGQFSQPLVLKDFPYDTQVLNVTLVAAGHPRGAVELVDSESPKSGVAKELSIPDWHLEDWECKPKEIAVIEGGRMSPGFQLRLKVSRSHRYHFVNILLPLVMIIGMSWVVFWIAPKNVNPRVSISVTAMLTLIAYRFAVGASLPKIGYLTRMDWFILGSSVLIFVALLQVVTTTFLAEKGREKLAGRFNVWMRVAAPVLFLVIAWASLLR